jgi:hypothetical protein
MPRPESVQRLIDRSSLGSPAVRRLRARTDSAVRARILRKASTLARGFGTDVTTSSGRFGSTVEKEAEMATNTGRGYRRGEVRNRSQVRNPGSGRWVERDATTGRFLNVKSDRVRFKGVRKER